MNLICVPYAGGNSYCYRDFGESIGPISVTTLELPGRGKRMNEPMLDRLDLMADDLFNGLLPLPDEPFALYGHSMGAALAWMLARRMVAEGTRQPDYLFVSGRRAPCDVQEDNRYQLPGPEFIEMLKDLGGCPAEVLADPELMELFEPILRADFRAVSTFEYEPAEPFDIPVVVMIGDDDEVTEESAGQWQRETTRPLVLRRFSGNHFFILDHCEEIRQLIRRSLSPSR